MFSVTKTTRLVAMNRLILQITGMLAVAVIISPMSVNDNPDLEGISRIFTEVCPNPNVLSSQSDSSLELNRLVNLQIELEEAADRADQTLQMITSWTSLLNSRMRDRFLVSLRKLQLPKCNHIELSIEGNSRLWFTEQLSNYVNFLAMRENDTDFNPYGVNGTAQIKRLRMKIMTVLYVLQGLLPLTGEACKNYALQDVAGHLIPLTATTGAAGLKRGFLVIAINLILETLRQIHVSVETRSLIIANDS